MKKILQQINFFFKIIVNINLSLRQKLSYLSNIFFTKLGVLTLESLFIGPSRICNLNCPHCYEIKKQGRPTQSLTTEETKKIIKKLKHLKIINVHFLGGEFMLRKDAMELISFAYSQGLLPHVWSNAVMLNEQVLKKMKKAGLCSLVISIDSEDAKKHDKSRGVNGLFAKIQKTLKICQRIGLKTQVWTYVSKGNTHDYKKLAKWAESFGVSRVGLAFAIYSGKLELHQEILSLEDRQRIRDEIKDLKIIQLCCASPIQPASEQDFCRGGGMEFIYVHPTGQVTPCMSVDYGYGDIKKEDIKDIVKKMKADFKKFQHLTGQCIQNFEEFRIKNKHRLINNQD